MCTSNRSLNFILALLTVLIAACSSVHDDVRTSDVTPYSAGKVRPIGSIEVPQTPMRSTWRPSSAHLSCAKGVCPAAVGVLLFAGASDGATVALMRCTAFLVSSDQIVSNGHCDFFSTHSGYFVFRNSQGDTEFREIASVISKAFTANSDPLQKENTSGRPDVLLLKLDRPIKDVNPIPINSDPKLPFGSLKAFVINEVPSTGGGEYTIEERICSLRRHQAFFPYDAGDAPDVVTAFDCEIIGGNSGSPMVDSSGAVRAIVQAGAKPETQVETSKAQPPFLFHQTVIAANIGCINFLGGNSSQCVVADRFEADRRFAIYQEQVLKQVSNPPAADFDSDAGFKALAFQLETPAYTFGYSFEVVYIPNCRKLETVLTQATYVLRHVILTFDEWADAHLAIAGESRLQAQVIKNQGERYEVEATWPAPFGELVEPQLDIRKQLGARFSIALPICSR